MVGQRPSASVQFLIIFRVSLTVVKEVEVDRYRRGREGGGGERENEWFIELGRLPMSNRWVGDGGGEAFYKHKQS